MLLESQSDANRTRLRSMGVITQKCHRWRSRLISECRHAIRTRDVTHGMLQVARIESVSSVLRQKHTAVGEFQTHTSFKNRLGVLRSTTCATATTRQFNVFDILRLSGSTPFFIKTHIIRIVLPILYQILHQKSCSKQSWSDKHFFIQ